MAKILITGVSGLVGKALYKRLSKQHEVIGLARKKSNTDSQQVFTWDYVNRKVEKKALENIDAVVHLAGAGVMDKRWTDDYKKEIVESRVNSLQFLFDEFKARKQFPKVLVCAGGIGYYGSTGTQAPVTELCAAGTDFLAQVCIEWERAAHYFEREGCRVVIVRTAVVLSLQGGALAPLLKLNGLKLSTSNGTGTQFFPWVHIDDLCKFYQTAIENSSLTGAFNLVAPELVTAKQFDLALQHASGKKALFPGAPAFVLKLVLGERAVTLLTGLPVVPERTLAQNFVFDYPNLQQALNQLLLQKLH